MKLEGSLKTLRYVLLLLVFVSLIMILNNSSRIKVLQESVLKKESLLSLADGFSSNLGSYQQYFRTFVTSPSSVTEQKMKQHELKSDSVLSEILKTLPADSSLQVISEKMKKNYFTERNFIRSYVKSIKNSQKLPNNAVNESELRMDYVWTDLFDFRELLKESIRSDNESAVAVADRSNLVAIAAMFLLVGICGIFMADTRRNTRVAKEQLLAEKAGQEKDLLVRSLLNNTTTSMHIADKNGVILYANKAFETLVGLRSEKIIGIQLGQLEIKKEIEFENKGIRSNLDLAYREVEETVNIDGKTHHFFTRKYPVENAEGHVFASAIISRDITERIKSEAGLKKSREEAEHARLTQEQFMANISHEIRTPMNGIMGMTDLLSGTNLNPEQRDYLETIQESSKNLMVLINDILDFSKIEAGMLELESIPFKINDVVDQVFSAILPKANQKNLMLTKQHDHKVPAYVMGDSLRLYQILANILSNAVKFTESGSVNLSISATSFNPPFLKLIFKITDTGIGIPKDRIDYIFQSFAQTSIDISRKFGGTGLGLAIVKQLVDMHEGSINVKSSLGEGSCFTVEIPFISCVGATLDSEDSKKFALLKNKSVLVVEDNLINQKVIVRTLDNVGILSTVCDNGFKAIELLSSNKFDLIIMDIQMPEIDGRETTVRIRKELQVDLPIIAMTASVSADEREKCRLAGMDDYISKPFVKEDLFEKMLLYI